MTKKYIVFDLDETLGNFVQLGIFCDVIENIFQVHLTQRAFNELCDTYNHFFRPNLFTILDSIKHHKKQTPHIKLAIYTNNNGNQSWTHKLKTYMEHKARAQSPLFDRVICAYKNRDNQTENCRSTYQKTPQDLARCVNSPRNAKFIFFDDQHHPQMAHESVTYMRTKPYTYFYPFHHMVALFLKTQTANQLLYNASSIIRSQMLNELDKYNYNERIISKEEYDVDSIVSKKINDHIHHFINT
jgi:hypothetical protein